MSVCRVCLAENREQYYSLFSIRDERTIAKTIMICTGVKIKRKDGLTQLVCALCTTAFHKFFELRQQCLEADSLLRKGLQSEHEDDNQSSQHEVVEECPEIDDYKIEILDIEFDPNYESSDKLATSLKHEETFSTDETAHDNLVVLHNVSIEEHVVTDSDICSEVPLRTRRTRRTHAPAVARKRRKLLSQDRTPPSKYICCSCPSAAFNSQSELEVHRTEQHERYRISDNVIRPFECDVCFQRFLTEKLLELHKSRPYKKREYVCTSCGNAFLANNTLKKHEEICNGPHRNYACEECGKRFTQIGSLNNHMMLHNAEKSHSCPICSKTFLKKFEVSIHMVTHTEEQPFPCDQCPARFKRKQALRNHQKHHSNPTPYKCDMCDEWFNNFSARKYHRQKVHDGIEPFRCDQCGASYGRKNRLEQHMKRMHAAGM